jgi:hypothetical protein
MSSLCKPKIILSTKTTFFFFSSHCIPSDIYLYYPPSKKFFIIKCVLPCDKKIKHTSDGQRALGSYSQIEQKKIKDVFVVNLNF